MNNQQRNYDESQSTILTSPSSSSTSLSFSKTLVEIIKFLSSTEINQRNINHSLEILHTSSEINLLALLLKVPGKNALRVYASAGYQQNVSFMEFPLSDDAIGWVYSHQHPIRVNSLQPLKFLNHHEKSSVLIVPVSYQGRQYGVILFENNNSVFTDEDENGFCVLGYYFGAALAISGLRKAINNSEIIFSFFSDIKEKINNIKDRYELIDIVSEELTIILGARSVKITLNNTDGTQNQTSDSENIKNIIPFSLSTTQGYFIVERDSPLTSLEQKFIKTVAQEFGSAIEKFEIKTIQKKFSDREKVLSDITSKIWASQTVDLILQTGVKELGATLGADEATIKLD